VVICLNTMQGLQTARLLHQRGINVYGISTDADHPFNRTRHCVEVLVRPPGGDMIDMLKALGPRLPTKAVLVPAQDWAVRDISAARTSLDPWYLYRLPDHATLEMLMDKDSFQVHAESVGLPVPESRILNTRAEAEKAAASMTFPCVLKPSARTPEWNRATSEKAIQLDSPQELLEVYDRVGNLVEAVVVQQWIVGPEDNLFSVNGYFDADGRSQATFVARKIRLWPVRTGQSSLGVECRNDEVLDLYHRLFNSVDYHGLAYLEAKQDSRTGRHYLIEPNLGRPTGRSAIAEAGGVELLDTMYCDIVGAPLPDAREQTYGQAKWIHLRRDTMSSITMMRNGELSVGDWLRSWRGPKFFAVWDPRDPAPFFGDLLRGVRLWRRSRRKSDVEPEAAATAQLPSSETSA
jgi:predicted ATP-grasp superfamily ATP-dependent carboligase